MSVTAFTLVTILLVFGYSEGSPAKIVTAEDLFGGWYLAAIMVPNTLGTFICARRFVTPGNSSNTYHIIDNLSNSGISLSIPGVGRIENNIESITYEAEYNAFTSNVIEKFANGENLIIYRDVEEPNAYLLYSRKRTVESETYEVFRNIAERKGLSITIISNANCT